MLRSKIFRRAIEAANDVIDLVDPWILQQDESVEKALEANLRGTFSVTLEAIMETSNDLGGRDKHLVLKRNVFKSGEQKRHRLCAE